MCSFFYDKIMQSKKHTGNHSMSLSQLFISIFNNDINETRNILNINPDFTEQLIIDDADMKELYTSCNKNNRLDNPLYYMETPLLFAARLGYKDMCKMLIDEFGANVNAITVYGFNAYMNSLFTISNENLETALMLLDNPGLNLEHTTYSKYDALAQTFKSFHHFHGQDKNLSYKLIDSLLDSLTSKGFDINKKQGKYNDTAFLVAAGNHNWLMVINLLFRGADYTAKNDMGYDMMTYFLGNQYLPPDAKEHYLKQFKLAAENSGQAYGTFILPEELYVCSISGKPFKFDSKRFG